MPDYLSLNRTTYDSLVDEYAARIKDDILKDTMLMAPFFHLLAEQYEEKIPLRILDIGCGSGLNLAMMTDQGHDAVGIDIAPNMVSLAKSTAPRSKIILGNFLERSFAKRTFHGVFAKAIIHCFPKSEAGRFLSKVFDLLHPRGVFYVTTTAEIAPAEGYYKKRDYDGEPIRFRAQWTPRELENKLASHGFKVKLKSFNAELHRNKQWVNFWMIKDP